MGRFIKQVFLFLFLVSVPVVVGDIWLRNMNTLYKEKVKGLHTQADSIQVLILGNSHANYGVDPVQFSLYAYNLANVSQSLYFDKRLALASLDKLPNLKYVFISVDFHSLYFSSQGQRDIWSYYGNGIRYKDKDYTLCNISPFLFGYTPRVSTSIITRAIKKKLKHTDKQLLDFDVETGVDNTDKIRKGFIGYTGTSPLFTETDIKERASVFNNNVIDGAAEKPEILADLSDFIYILKKKNISPILFTAPVFKNYYACLNKKTIAQNLADIQSLCQRNDIEYWDYSQSDQFVREDFFNADHLNKTGAAKFSKMLNARLMK